MKNFSTCKFVFGGILASVIAACGHSEDSSSLKGTSHDACVEAAQANRDKAYAQAAKNHEAEAAACYALMDDQQYLPVSLCLNKAEAARKQALDDAHRAWTSTMSICEPR